MERYHQSRSPKRVVNYAAEEMRSAILLMIASLILLSFGVVALFWVTPDKIPILAQLFSVSEETVIAADKTGYIFAFMFAGMFVIVEGHILYRRRQTLEEILDDVPQNLKKTVNNARKAMKHAIFLTIGALLMFGIAGFGLFWVTPDKLPLLVQLFRVSWSTIVDVNFIGIFGASCLSLMFVISQATMLIVRSRQLEEILDDLPEMSSQPEKPTEAKKDSKVSPSVSD